MLLRASIHKSWPKSVMYGFLNRPMSEQKRAITPNDDKSDSY
jgi:hypothetical protein